MTKTVLRVALLSCAALMTGPAIANHSWGSYHWARTSNPLRLDVMRAVASKWDASVTTSISDWNKATGVLSLTGKTAAGVNPKRCTAIPGKVLVCNAAYGQRGWLGIATIWASGNHITQATTKLNDSYHDLAPYNTAPWRALVACQEIGHDFGLAHQNEDFGPPNLGSCMDYTNDPDGGGTYGASNEHPNSHDYAQLQTIYSHTDTTNTSSSQATNFGLRVPGRAPVAPPGLNSEAGDSPAEWGRAIHTDGQGRPDVFVQDQAGGVRKITHVLWVPGKAPPGLEHHHDE
ncbi:MAG: hypothetical protein ACJ8FC_10080 [Sphingomicrobium sp.]